MRNLSKATEDLLPRLSPEERGIYLSNMYDRFVNEVNAEVGVLQ